LAPAAAMIAGTGESDGKTAGRISCPDFFTNYGARGDEAGSPYPSAIERSIRLPRITSFMDGNPTGFKWLDGF